MHRIVPLLALVALVAASSVSAHEGEEMTMTVAGYGFEYDRVAVDDTDGDGIDDLTTYFIHDAPVMSAADEDRDGEADRWILFDEEGNVLKTFGDRNGDGMPDMPSAAASEGPGPGSDPSQEGGPAVNGAPGTAASPWALMMVVGAVLAALAATAIKKGGDR